MERFTITLILTAILVALAVGGLAIGLIFTGKSRLRFCGRHLWRKRDSECGTKIHCPLCDHDKKD